MSLLFLYLLQCQLKYRLVKMSISQIRPTIIRDNEPHISVIFEQNIAYHSN